MKTFNYQLNDIVRITGPSRRPKTERHTRTALYEDCRPRESPQSVEPQRNAHGTTLARTLKRKPPKALRLVLIIDDV